MLPKKRRVSRKIFSTLGKNSKSYHSPSLTLRVYKREECVNEVSKFSFVTSLKISKKAPTRNLLKRRGYSVVKEIINDIENCFICVFYFKKEAIDLGYKEIKKDIITLLKEAHVISIY